MDTSFPGATKTGGNDSNDATVWKAAPSYTLRVFRDVETDMNADTRRLTAGILSEKCVVRVVRRFRRCANVIQCTYTNLDGIVYSLLHT